MQVAVYSSRSHKIFSWFKKQIKHLFLHPTSKQAHTMKLFLATYYVFLLSSNASVVSSTSIRGAGLKKEQEMHENHEKQESLSVSVSTPPEQGKDERSLLFGKEEEGKHGHFMKIKLNDGFLSH